MRAKKEPRRSRPPFQRRARARGLGTHRSGSESAPRSAEEADVAQLAEDAGIRARRLLRCALRREVVDVDESPPDAKRLLVRVMQARKRQRGAETGASFGGRDVQIPVVGGVRGKGKRIGLDVSLHLRRDPREADGPIAAPGYEAFATTRDSRAELRDALVGDEGEKG